MLLKLKLASMENPLDKVLCLTFDEMDCSSQMRFVIMPLLMLLILFRCDSNS